MIRHNQVPDSIITSGSEWGAAGKDTVIAVQYFAVRRGRGIIDYTVRIVVVYIYTLDAFDFR